MDRGTVKWCDAVKGIGFRALDRDGNRVSIQSASTATTAQTAQTPQAKAVAGGLNRLPSDRSRAPAWECLP
jgi:CspA family cold shock protein